MEITFSAANTVGLNNPGTEIITLVKDGSGNFINPPSYDKMRAYLRSGEVPMLFVTTEGGETGNLYQLVEYSETENKIRFSNSAEAIEFCAGCEVPNVYDISVPKPLTYDYMPEGYPKKSAGTVTVMEEQALTFTDAGGTYVANLPDGFKVTAGQTYVVNWDGTEYECVGGAVDETLYSIGNTSIAGESNNTGEPFLYTINAASGAVGQFFTLDTTASHTVSVTTVMEVITPMTEDFLPTTAKNTTVFYI